MEEIIIVLAEDKTALDIQRGGLTNFCSWERLRNESNLGATYETSATYPWHRNIYQLTKLAGYRSNERILGLVATHRGIDIRLGYIN